MRLFTLLSIVFNKLKNIANYVIEEGTSGIWQYRKWNNGDAECWGLIAAPGGTTTTVEGGLYWRSFSQSLPPGLFNSTPLPLPAVKGNWIGGVVINNNTTKDSVQGYVWGSRSGSTPGQLAVILRITGTWK